MVAPFIAFIKKMPTEAYLICGFAGIAYAFGVYTASGKMSTPDGIYSPPARNEVRERLEADFDEKNGSFVNKAAKK